MSAPRATYRIQLRQGTTFRTVAAAAGYLADLGISHAYLSPVLAAVEGSTHGYDVIDPTRFDPALGDEADFGAMCAALGARGIELLVDIVPNHLAVTPANPWWWDVLEHGRASHHAAAFDIDWSSASPCGDAARSGRARPCDGSGDDARILLPLLGERYAEALGAITLERRGGKVVVLVHGTALPAAPRSIGWLLGPTAALRQHAELAFLADALVDVPRPDDVDRAARRLRDIGVLAELLASLCDREPEIAAAVDEALRATAADPQQLDAFLERQNWRIGFWRAAADELGYRRFFDIDSLCGVRVEDPDVFFATHRQLLAWHAQGGIAGFRIDHVDGLLDPGDYLDRLHTAAPGAWIVVEKILAPGEQVPTTWPIGGTTGYDFARLADAAFAAPEGEAPLRALWAEAVPDAPPWETVARDARRAIVHGVLSSERDRLVDLAHAHATALSDLRDASRRELGAAIAELLASFPVYRTYRRAGAPASETDRARIAEAVAAARASRPDVSEAIWSYFERALGGAFVDGGADAFTARFQQVAPAVMAKGVEDTAGYRAAWFPPAAEVGGAPERYGIATDELHAALAALPPRGLLATSTHDTKRGEDLRAGMLAVTRDPARFVDAVRRWRARVRRDGAALPEPALEHVWWWTIGCTRLDEARATQFLTKSARELKQRTSWTRPDEAYEAELRAFAARVLGDRELVDDIEQFRQLIDPSVRLAQTLLKLTAPGVPDFYQGSEWANVSLVDPDNRTPVDFAQLAARATEAQRDDARLLFEKNFAQKRPDRAKHWLVRTVLALRAAQPAWFEGAYRPLAVTGAHADRVLAFARGDDLAVVIPRSQPPDWGDTRVELPAHLARDVLGGSGAIRLALYTR
ncbi:MAG TPA: malto-oligosyltrehalose synthase [Kofleriaceae bacterium]